MSLFLRSGHNYAGIMLNAFGYLLCPNYAGIIGAGLIWNFDIVTIMICLQPEQIPDHIRYILNYIKGFNVKVKTSNVLK